MSLHNAATTARSPLGLSQNWILVHIRRLGIVPPLLLLVFAAPAPVGATIAGIPSPCPFHWLTGLPCPGCGLTRAVVCCAHGLWLEAVGYHPLGPMVFMALAGLTAIRVISLFTPRWRITFSANFINLTLGLSALALTIIWGARLTGVLPAPP